MAVRMAVTMAPPKVHCLADPLTDWTVCLRASQMAAQMAPQTAPRMAVRMALQKVHCLAESLTDMTEWSKACLMAG